MEWEEAIQLIRALNAHNELIKEQNDILKDIKDELCLIRGNL